MRLISKYLLIAFSLFIIDTNAQVFADVTSSAGIDAVETMSGTFGSGASIADFDNDGDLDFFVGTEFGLNNRIYENIGNGQFQEVATSLGVTSTFRNRTALWVDFNGDTLLDLIIVGDCRDIDASCVNRADIKLYKQLTSGNFEIVENSGLDFGTKYNVANVTKDFLVGGISAADINNDNWLDILVTFWDRNQIGAEMTMFLNNAGQGFTDISSTSFPNQNSVSRFQPIFNDFDNDGFIDFYISIDFTENELWRNLGNNQFEEIANDVGADNAFNEMGLTIGDYDNDGDFDLYATNISRIDPGDGNMRHNILLKNNFSQTNNLGFEEVSESLGVDSSAWDWGTTFFDANNDGWLDIASTNGYDIEGWLPDQSKLWLNVEGLLFSDISEASNFDDLQYAATLLAFDMDRDGDLDLLQSMKVRSTLNADLPVRLYENDISESTNPNNYLVVKPRMNGTNHYAIGAVVKIIYDNGKTGMRLITAGTSFYGQEPAEAFFGLSDNNTIDEIRVEWPDNTVTVVTDVIANQVITITNDNVLDVNNTELIQLKTYPNPASDVVTVEGNSIIKLIEVYNLLGQKVLFQNTDSIKIKFNISSLSKGSYFLKVKDINSNLQTFKILKK
ncbi:FG-GAP-like repeat-containing protein [Winogradskyella litorisediminis]|uniref:FG-GAP-like repeat-containing protein n=1 Tax=Winogradskyella litorisediminis TaxID=1156618 RepID=A0ABW3N8N5_9FLAO